MALDAGAIHGEVGHACAWRCFTQEDDQLRYGSGRALGMHGNGTVGFGSHPAQHGQLLCLFQDRVAQRRALRAARDRRSHRP